jgi:hypothetical protein
MSSANGFRLEVSQGGKVFNLVATWAAPFFAVSDFDAEHNEAPGLTHCDDIEHARMYARMGAKVFNAKFEPIEL